MENMKAENKNEKGNEVAKTHEVKIQSVSKSYTLKSFAENIRKIKDFGWLNDEDRKKLDEILKKAKLKYMDDEF